MAPIATRLRSFWRRIEPGLQIDRDNLIERWDCTGEGRATCVSFEGFGITFSLFIGRTPAFRPEETDRSRQLARWYAGEAQA